MSPRKSINRHAGSDSSIVDRTSRTRLTWSSETDIKPNSNGPHATDRTRDWPWTDLVDSRSLLSWLSICSRVLPVVWGPLTLGLMSVAKLQVSLVRLVRSTMLESLPACLFMDFSEIFVSSSSQIRAHQFRSRPPYFFRRPRPCPIGW